MRGPHRGQVITVSTALPDQTNDKRSNLQTFSNSEPTLQECRQSKETYQVYVWNDIPGKAQRRLRLFPDVLPLKTQKIKTTTARETDSGPTPQAPRCPLDDGVCGDLEGAKRVAAEACRLLDRYPLDFDEAEFPEEITADSTMSHSGFRTLIELQSLRVLKADFDFRVIDAAFRSHRLVSGSYQLAPEVLVRTLPSDAMWEITIPCFITDKGRPKKTWIRVKLYESHFNEESLNALPDVPEWFGFTPVQPPDDHLPLGLKIAAKSMMKIIKLLTWKLFGCVGTMAAVRRALRESVEHTGRVKSWQGPFNGKAIFWVSRSKKQIHVRKAVQDTIKGNVPHASTQLSARYIAFALQRAHEVFMAGKGIIAAIEELFVCLDELQILQSKPEEFAHLKSEMYAKSRTATAHHCMHCLELELCKQMAWSADGRWVCRRHFQHDLLPVDELQKGRLKAITAALERDCQWSLLSTHDREAIARDLTKNHLDAASGYKDKYNGHRNEDCVGQPLHAFSVDAVYPIWKVDASYYYHHSNNVCLTSRFFNYLKGPDIPHVLALAGEAARLAPYSLYQPDIERRFDHCAKIRQMLPYTKAERHRVASMSDPERWEEILRSMTSGVYDVNTSAQSFYEWTPLPDTKIWSEEDTSRLQRLCEEIRMDETINPEGLKMPEFNGVPWLFNREHGFPDLDWQFYARIFTVRYHRMRWHCDRHNEHPNESPETLFLTCVILWYLLGGGKDEILGLQLTIFEFHPLRFSIGRALHVDPGSIMRSGWTTPHPTSLSEYSEELRTITMEAWMINRGKSNFPTDTNTKEVFTEAIKEISRKCELWNLFNDFSLGLERIIWAKTWKSSDKAVAPAVDEEEEDDFDVEDDEDLTDDIRRHDEDDEGDDEDDDGDDDQNDDGELELADN